MSTRHDFWANFLSPLPSLRLLQGPVEGLVQEYEPPTLPCGFIFRFELTSTWDDRFYMGLNGIELYDQFDRLVTISEKNIHAVCVGDVSSVSDLEGCGGDPRTPLKLIDRINNTWDDSHMWLAPFERGTTNTIYIVFEEPLTLSLVKVSKPSAFASWVRTRRCKIERKFCARVSTRALDC